jgi:hypothetical protein
VRVAEPTLGGHLGESAGLVEWVRMAVWTGRVSGSREGFYLTAIQEEWCALAGSSRKPNRT